MKLTLEEKVFLLALCQDHARQINEAGWTDKDLQKELAMATDLFGRLKDEIDAQDTYEVPEHQRCRLEDM